MARPAISDENTIPYVTTSVRVPVPVHRALNHYRADSGRTAQDIFVELLTEFLTYERYLDGPRSAPGKG